MNADYKILVVDDNESGRYLKSHILKRASYRVTEAATGGEALRAVTADQPALILLDVKLPDMSGIEVCRQVKEVFPSILILQTSADFTTKQNRAMGLAGGADSYLIEPLEPEELLATVSALLRLYTAEQELRQSNETLERKVGERTREIGAINERLMAEIKQRTEAEEILRHTQKLDALGQVTGGIAHDFNNLLTIILGNLESLRRHMDQGKIDEPKFRRFIDNAFFGSQRAAGITKRLLAFSRRQVLAPKTLDANTLISGMSDLLRQTLGENVVVNMVLGRNLWPTLIDPFQLESAVLNLAINARDAMPAGGSLTIETENFDLREGLRRGKLELDPGEYVRLAVSDTGMGMSEEVKNYAFEPFFTTKGVGQGTGLGLSQVYGFVKQSAGQIVISSRIGEGTTIEIYLPRFNSAQAQPSSDAETKVTVVTKPGDVVLVVEDDDDVRNHSIDILREMGFEVLESRDADDALRLIDAHPEISLIFTDIGLPGGMNGYELAEEAIRRQPALKILLTTGYAEQALATHASFNPNTTTITKPFTFAALASTVAHLFTRDAAGGQILLVEDEAIIRDDTIEALSELGFNVAGAGTARQALKVFSDNPENIAAVIVDIGLPDRDGESLANDFRAARPHLPIILASGYGASGSNSSFTADPRVAFLAKPYRLSELEAALRNFGVDPQQTV